MNSHQQVVEQSPQSLQELGVTRCEMCHSVLGVDNYGGTVVHLDARDPGWLAESFKPAVTKFFQGWTKVRIQALTFNGETVFDYRLWPEPPVLEPITIKVREPQIPEWRTSNE